MPILPSKDVITLTTDDAWKENDECSDYTVFEYGKPVKNYVQLLPEELQKGLPQLMETYETIRNLDRFDPNNCPIMEFVTFNGKNYFLQYHEGRKFEEARFSLDRAPERDEIPVFFVRGATQPEGMSCNVTVSYAWFYGKGNFTLPKDEEGSFDVHFTPAFTELMVRKRKLQISERNEREHALINFVAQHENFSKLMKPEVSIVESMRKIVPDEEYEKLIDMMTNPESKEDVRIAVNVVSDGRIAYLRRI